MTADEVMLRRRPAEDAAPPWLPRPRPLTPEELAALGPARRLTLPDPRPYVAVRMMDRKPAVEIGLKGTF